METKINLDGHTYQINDEWYIVTDNDSSSSDRWFAVGFPAGNFGVVVMLRARDMDDAIESVGEYVHEHATYSSNRPSVPRIILVDDDTIEKATEEEVAELYYPINGGEFYIDMPAMIEEVKPLITK